MTATQNEKAARFRALHDSPGVFIIPNPWDIGSARLLAGLGFPALATSSAAAASVIGRKDHGLTREQALAHSRMIVDATDLPVSADLEKGFGDAPEVVAKRSASPPTRDWLDVPSKMRLPTNKIPYTTLTWPLNGLLPQLRLRVRYRSLLF